MDRFGPASQERRDDSHVSDARNTDVFDPTTKAKELDALAYECLVIASNQKIEQRECSQRLQAEVTALTQGQATAVGKIYERYLFPDSMPHNQSMGHEILFGAENSPAVTGFTYSAADPRDSRNRTITAKVAPPEAKWGLSQTPK
jgi:hypothetical protein